MPIKSKLPNTETTIFSVMSQLAAEHNAVNLSQGFPDFSPPPALVDLVSQHMREGRNQYAMMTGVPPLRTAIAEKVATLYGASVDSETEVTVTSGATEALFTAITACVHPGDEVIVFDPAYDSYDPAIRLAGATPIHIPLEGPKYQPDWQRVRSTVTPRTKMIIINSPHNPTGAVLTGDDLTELAAICEHHDLLVLSDEVYEHIVFDNKAHHSVLSDPVLRRRAFAVSSFGKTYHMTGWKIAYCVASPELTHEFRKVHQYVTFCTTSPMQFAIADFMQQSNHHLELSAFYQAKRDHFANAIKGSRWKLLPCHGTYFQLLGYRDITDEKDLDFARRLTIENGVAAIPISPFCEAPQDSTVLRFCFAKDEATLDKAAEILCKI